MTDQFNNRPWRAKFRDAFRGLWLAARSERSYLVHLPMAAAVAVVAIVLRVNLVEGCLLVLCVGVVLTAETFNTALERLARPIAATRNESIGAALDMASGAVLIASLSAAAVGSTIFVYRLGLLAGWWSALARQIQ
jgi:diacylglycerol kinase